MAEPKPATDAEAATLQRVYEKLAELLMTLREARSHIRHPELLAIVNAEIDRQLEADAALRQAVVEYTGRPVQDPY